MKLMGMQFFLFDYRYTYTYRVPSIAIFCRHFSITFLRVCLNLYLCDLEFSFRRFFAIHFLTKEFTDAQVSKDFRVRRDYDIIMVLTDSAVSDYHQHSGHIGLAEIQRSTSEDGTVLYRLRCVSYNCIFDEFPTPTNSSLTALEYTKRFVSNFSLLPQTKLRSV